MAKVVVENVDKVFKEIEQKSNGVFKSKRMLERIGKFIVERIVATTRSGKSIVTGDKLKDLSENYIAYRSSTSKPTDKRFFSPGRSNLTFSGELLSSITFLIDESTNQVTVKPTGIRSVIVKSKGIKSDEDELSNEKLAEYVSDARPFLGLDSLGEERINKMIQEEITRIFSKS